MLDDLNKEGNTIIVITHDNEVASKCRRIVTIKDGKIMSDVLNEKGTGEVKNMKLKMLLKWPYLPSEAINEIFPYHAWNNNWYIFSYILVGLGEGTKQQVSDQIESLGTNLITVNLTGNSAASIFKCGYNRPAHKTGHKKKLPLNCPREV